MICGDRSSSKSSSHHHDHKPLPAHTKVKCLAHDPEMFLPSCQTVKIKWIDELTFSLSFLLLITVSKVQLLEKWTLSPTSFQGWQVLFSFAILVCLLIVQPRIRNELKPLNKTSLFLVLPVCVTYGIAHGAGAVSLSGIPVGVFIAWSNVAPAVLALITRKCKTYLSPIFIGCLIICVSVVVIFFIESTESNRLPYLALLIYSLISIVQSVYLRRINLQIPDFTLLFYNTVFAVIELLPVSIYNVSLFQLDFRHIFPCFVTGFLCLLVQIFAFRIKAKSTKFLTVQGVAQLLTILASIYMFDESVDIWVWCMISVNWFVTGCILNKYDEDNNKKPEIILVVPNVTKDIYVTKYVNYGDMA